MWATDSMPCTMPVGEDAPDMGALKLGTYPPVNGTRFMISEYPPGNHPLMHRTETVDYVIVIDERKFPTFGAAASNAWTKRPKEQREDCPDPGSWAQRAIRSMD